MAPKEKAVLWAYTLNKITHTMWKSMNNYALKWFQKLCAFLFEVACSFGQMWRLFYTIKQLMFLIGEILSREVGQHAGVKFLASLHTKTIFYNLGSRSNLKQNSSQNQLTTLQSMMNAKLSHQRFWYCYENGLIRYPTMYVWVSSWLPFTLVYPMLTEFVTHHRLEGCELLVLAKFCNFFCH